LREEDFSDGITRAGGRAYIVGGWVRDEIRGAEPKDKDYVVTGVGEGSFESLFPAAHRVGRSFPVYRLRIDGETRDVAFARSEKKTGLGYRGFDVCFDRSISIREDLERRDTTINSMALEVGSRELIDPFGGARDIESRIIRATSERFRDDPVRALRAARQSAQFGYSIEPRTMKMMNECRGELEGEPSERIMQELSLALGVECPSVFFRALLDAGLLEVTFPQLYALVGVEHDLRQHPEGDAFAHTMLMTDRVAAVSSRPEVRFAALAHDIGKALVPARERPHYYDHERLGLAALAEWNRKMTLPKLWMRCAKFAIREHMRARTISRPGKIADFLTRLERNSIGTDGISAVMMADGGWVPSFLQFADLYYRAMNEITGNDIPTNLTGPERGRWLRAQRIEAVTRLR